MQWKPDATATSEVLGNERDDYGIASYRQAYPAYSAWLLCPCRRCQRGVRLLRREHRPRRGASYEVGLRYNNMLAEERTQNALQWRHQSQIAQGSRLRVSVTDNAGTPVPHLAVTGTFGRPATNIADRSLV